VKTPAYKKKGQSDKIEINRYKIYRTNDPIQFAHLFYPAKNANHRRAAFLAIYFEIKNAEDRRLESTDHIAAKYDLSPSTVIKARAKMARLGLIAKMKYGWQFCSVFKNTMERLIEVVDCFKAPVERKSQLESEKMYIEMAKGGNG
jgi:hypothetical protein